MAKCPMILNGWARWYRTSATAMRAIISTGRNRVRRCCRRCSKSKVKSKKSKSLCVSWCLCAVVGVRPGLCAAAHQQQSVIVVLDIVVGAAHAQGLENTNNGGKNPFAFLRAFCLCGL